MKSGHHGAGLSLSVSGVPRGKGIADRRAEAAPARLREFPALEVLSPPFIHTPYTYQHSNKQHQPKKIGLQRTPTPTAVTTAPSLYEVCINRFR
jgi:hypothetical protein